MFSAPSCPNCGSTFVYVTRKRGLVCRRCGFSEKDSLSQAPTNETGNAHKIGEQ